MLTEIITWIRKFPKIKISKQPSRYIPMQKKRGLPLPLNAAIFG